MRMGGQARLLSSIYRRVGEKKVTTSYTASPGQFFSRRGGFWCAIMASHSSMDYNKQETDKQEMMMRYIQ